MFIYSHRKVFRTRILKLLQKKDVKLLQKKDVLGGPAGGAPVSQDT